MFVGTIIYVTSKGRESRDLKNPFSVRHSRMVTVCRFTVTSVMKIWSATGDRDIQKEAPRRTGRGGGGGGTAKGASAHESSSSGCGAGGGGCAPFGSAGAVAVG